MSNLTSYKTSSVKKRDLLRASFQLDEEYIHLSLGMIAPHPKEVREKIEWHRQGFDRNPTLYYRNKDLYENQVLAKAADYLECKPTEIALTESTTLGLATVYTGIQLEEGCEILTTFHEHYASWEVLHFKAKRENIQLTRISLYEDPTEATEEGIVKRLLLGITSKTRLIALTWVHSGTGLKIPLKKICKEIAKVNKARNEKERIFVAVDGLHALGIEKFGVHDLGVDFFIAGCHKSLFGPRGTGIVWASQTGWNQVIPIATSFKREAFWDWYKQSNPNNSCPKAWLCSPGGFQAYEHRWALDEAFNFHLSIGKEEIETYIHSLNYYCKQKMSRIANVRIYTPLSTALSSGLVCFEINGMDPESAVEKLIQKKIISGQTPYHYSLNRFMPGILNDSNELDQALDALEEIAQAKC